MKVKWKPNPKQIEALVRTEDEILYGGARGGGKTDAGMAWLLYDIENPKYRALVIRQNAKDLSDWIDRARDMYAGTGAVFVGQPTEIKFPSGAIIRTGHLKDAGAYTQYQGHEYHKILIEELTKIPREKDYEALLGSNRSTVGIKPQVFCTTNPDGDGHEWVKERFRCEEVNQIGKTIHENNKTKIFIPARIEDNPHLVDADPGYVSYLESIKDETLRRQWREGSWEEPNVEGAYYVKQIQKAYEENRIRFVPYESSLKVFTFWDIGIADAMAIWFMQQVGNELRLIDYYENEGEGFNFYAQVLQERGYLYEAHYGPHDLEVRELSDGKSRKEKASALGINFQLVPNIPIADGIDAARDILGKCFFDAEKCKEGIRALKNYKKVFDEKRNVYKSYPDHNWASHAADAFRYFAVGYAPVQETARIEFTFDKFGRPTLK